MNKNLNKNMNKAINKTKDSDFDFMKQVQRDTKNLAQNPDYNKVNEDYRLQKIIRKNIKRYL